MSHPGGDDGCDELYISVDWMIWYFVSSLALALAGALVYVYYLKKGQFEKNEDVKYQMLREEE